jgi:hypothetical protein
VFSVSGVCAVRRIWRRRGRLFTQQALRRTASRARSRLKRAKRGSSRYRAPCETSSLARCEGREAISATGRCAVTVWPQLRGFLLWTVQRSKGWEPKGPTHEPHGRVVRECWGCHHGPALVVLTAVCDAYVKGAAGGFPGVKIKSYSISISISYIYNLKCCMSFGSLGLCGDKRWISCWSPARRRAREPSGDGGPSPWAVRSIKSAELLSHSHRPRRVTALFAPCGV